MGLTYTRGDRGINVCLEGELVVAHITADGMCDITSEYFSLEPEDLREIAQKVEEVRKFGYKHPTCEVCGGTPYFPNVRPADKVFEEHVCSAPMHINRPR